jgi:hypothetical protein
MNGDSGATYRGCAGSSSYRGCAGRAGRAMGAVVDVMCGGVQDLPARGRAHWRSSSAPSPAHEQPQGTSGATRLGDGRAATGGPSSQGRAKPELSPRP